MSPNACLVATDEGGEIVASIALVVYGPSMGWVAMVLVDPARRGEGIATRLLEQGLLLLEHVDTVRLDATPAGYPVYLRVGFREEYRIQRMQRDALPAGAAVVRDTGDSQSLRPMSDADFVEVVAFDREVFGADRRTLLEDFRSRAPEYAWVSGGRRIDGFVLGRPGHSFDHLGPLVARDEADARRLVARCLSLHASRRFVLDAMPHGTWAAWLADQQFTLQRPFVRMYRGARHDERSEQIFAIAGAEFA
jgi:ribosomal protein S18 acetylase RimI-like enzyme